MYFPRILFLKIRRDRLPQNFRAGQNDEGMDWNLLVTTDEDKVASSLSLIVKILETFHENLC